MGFFRTILFAINQMIFEFIGKVYNFLIDIAEQGNIIYENTNLGDATSKIYILVGIIMLFRMGIILLRYIANPDGVMDKKDGFGKHIVPHIVVVLVMIVFTPTLFTWLYEFQSIIIKDGVLTKFFLTDNSVGEPAQCAADTEAESICKCYDGSPCTVNADQTRTCKVHTKEFSCETGHLNEVEGTSGSFSIAGSRWICTDTKGSTSSNGKTPVQEKIDMTCPADKIFKFTMHADTRPSFPMYTASCVMPTFSSKGESFADAVMFGFIEPSRAVDSANYPEGYKKAKEEVEKNCPINYGLLSDDLNKKDGTEYILEYNGFISLITGIIVLGMLIASLFQVGIRLFKLLALEIMAPIPIISYLDPTKKAGTSPFDKWISTLMKTYVDLFVRLLTISFVVLIIKNISNYLGTNLGTSAPGVEMLRIFIIIAALMFMNIAPTFIGGILGVETEKGSMNPFTQVKKLPFAGEGIAGVAGGAMMGAAGLAVGGAVGAAKGMMNGNIGAGLMSGSKLGAETGFRTGMTVNTKAGAGKNFGSVLKGSMGIAGKADASGKKMGIAGTFANDIAKSDEKRTVGKVWDQAHDMNDQFDARKKASNAYTSDWDQAHHENLNKDFNTNAVNQYSDSWDDAHKMESNNVYDEAHKMNELVDARNKTIPFGPPLPPPTPPLPPPAPPLP